MLVAARAEDLPRLNYLGCKTVRVHGVVRAMASLDELWADAQKLKVAHLLYGVCSEHFQEL